MAHHVSPHIVALLDERRGYVMRGLTERVRQIDEQLAALGYISEVASVEQDDERASLGGRSRRRRVANDADN